MQGPFMGQKLRPFPVVEVPHASQCGVDGSRLRQGRLLHWNEILLLVLPTNFIRTSLFAATCQVAQLCRDGKARDEKVVMKNDHPCGAA
jgi:hypothetical protein